MHALMCDLRVRPKGFQRLMSSLAIAASLLLLGRTGFAQTEATPVSLGSADSLVLKPSGRLNLRNRGGVTCPGKQVGEALLRAQVVFHTHP